MEKIEKLRQKILDLTLEYSENCISNCSKEERDKKFFIDYLVSIYEKLKKE